MSLSANTFHTFKHEYLSPDGHSWSNILSVTSMGWGKFYGRMDQNCGFHGNQRLPLTYGEMMSPPFLICLIEALANFQVYRTGIKSREEIEVWPDWTVHFGVTNPLTPTIILIEFIINNGEICIHASMFIIDQIFVKLVGNQGKY